MNVYEFLEYINDNFALDSASAFRLLSNICHFIERHAYTEVEQYTIACELLEGTIGLSDDELRKISF